MNSSISTPCVCALLALLITLAAATCVDTNVKGLVIDTPRNVYGTDESVALEPIVVRTVGNIGQFLHTGAETVTVVPPAGFTLTGTLTRTTSGGTATFDDLQLTGSPPQGAAYLDFNLCNGVRVDRLEVIIAAGSASKIIWFVPPEGSITSFGFIPVKPILAMADADDAVTDLNNHEPWTLETNDTDITLLNGQFTPSSLSGQLIPFSDLKIVVDASMTGRTFELRLKSIGSYTSANPPPGIQWPEPFVIRIAQCSHDFAIAPTIPGATMEHFNVPMGSTNRLGLRGWNFMEFYATTGRCRYNGLAYPLTVVDLCNIECQLPGSLPANSGFPLEISYNGLWFETLGTMVIVDESQRSLVPEDPIITVYRESVITVKAKFNAVDRFGRRLHGRVPNSPPLTVTCVSNSLFANQKRIWTAFYNPKTNEVETPNNTPALVDGAAEVDFVFGGHLEPDVHRFCCNTTGIDAGCVDINVTEECTSPPFITNVTSVGCALDAATSNLFNCKTQGIAAVIVTGGNFGFSGAAIRIGPYECSETIHDSEFPTRILRGVGCKGEGMDHTVFVFRDEEHVYGMYPYNYSFGIVPVIDSIVGCPDDFYPSTANCRTDGTSMVQIRGENFGSFGARVFFYYFVPPGATVRIEAATVAHIDAAGTLLNATGFPGQGSRFEVAVNTSWGEIKRQSDVTMTYVASAILQCPMHNGIQCNGKGDCNTAIGSCVCFNDDENGRWTGSACQVCQSTYFGASCAQRCPGGATPCSGSGRGTCSDGLAGTGKCTCTTGYGGLNCEFECPGGASSPCSNRGACIQDAAVPFCNCTQSPSFGFWGGASCRVCATNYVGATCTQQCPIHFFVPDTACSAQGQCRATSLGAACLCNATRCGNACELGDPNCGTCAPGLFGPDCDQQCPGYASVGGGAVSVCSDAGVCQEGPQGSGLCVCDEGFAGDACEFSCPRTLVDGEMKACSGNGQCSVVTGTCTCETSFAGPACDIPCPGMGTPDGICSGRGSCNSGAEGDGKCSCNSGFSGPLCESECPGSAISPCSFHGTCNPDVTCTCHNDTILGFWTGGECSSCAEGWYGPHCNGTCVMIDGLQCAGRGQCSSTLDCICATNIAQGFWDEPNCTTCKQYYWGPSCRMQCPGGACNPCSGNGMCSDGLDGDGTCACFSNASRGFWAGEKCSECQPNFFSPSCNLRCPANESGATCTGHGVCSDGLRGNGTCICTQNEVEGFWGGDDCSDCHIGYYGAGCLSVCPGTGPGETCSGHGQCDSGITGDGTCTCEQFWGDPECATGCFVDPETPNTPCSGHGTCLDGASRSGTCECDDLTIAGHWAGETCGDCKTGYFGSSCINECPINLGEFCSGHGMCDDGISGSGLCVCDAGWALATCSAECNGGALNGGCSGHGTCSQATGECTCFADAAEGFWAGDDCSQCDPLYDSLAAGCLIRCPTTTANPTLPCNGHGRCMDGECTSCDLGFCGDRCENTGLSCESECPTGYFGDDCTSPCPGLLESGTQCFGNGLCSAGRRGRGRCNCFSGFWGPDCSNECRPSAGDPCSGHGTCDREVGTCQCSSGYETEDCSVLCPGGPSNVCSGNGTCSKEDGTCGCLDGYALADCSQLCPATIRTVDPGGVARVSNICSTHGVCIQENATCACFSDGVNGFWNGSRCDRCQPGWHGSMCNQRCINGHTQGTLCICDMYWSGASCDHQCPGMSSDLSSVCTGHGSCLWGHEYNFSKCECEPNYFTADCRVFCSEDRCKNAPYFLVNGRCNNQTGNCDCEQSQEKGFWADTSTYCTTCRLFYWGPECKDRCPCMENGGCEKDTGVCQCFDSDALGHFDGTACERCKAGFIGSQCKGADVAITRQRPCSSITPIRDTSGFILMDVENDIIVTGGRPLIVCNLTTRAVIAEINNINATVVAGGIMNSEYLALSLQRIEGRDDPGDQVNVKVRRGRRPDFSAIDAGAIFHANHSGAGSVVASSRRRLQTLFTHASPAIVETILLNSEERLIIFSTGLVQHIVGLERVGEYRFGEHFSQVQGAAVTHSVLISPHHLLLGGTLDGEWQLIGVPLPLSSNAAPVMLRDILAAKGIPYCLDGNCRAMAKLVTEGTYIVGIVLTRQGAGLLRFRFTQLELPEQRIETNAILEGLDPTSVINVTAMILDPLSGAGFVAMNQRTPSSQDPSTIYKFDLLNLQVYGSVRFQKVVDTFEIVTGFTKNDETRTLFAAVPLEMQINVVPLNLFAVTKVFPHVADIQGGTVITVEGEGFINDRYFTCNFNGTNVPAMFISTREAHCVAPVGGDERCEGTPLEISVGPDQFTKNDVALRRVTTPRIHSVFSAAFAAETPGDNAYGNLTGGERVILKGHGFQQSDFLACRFTSDGLVKHSFFADRDYAYSRGRQGVVFNNARFINATDIECDQPAFERPTRGRATIEATLDGNVYSRSGLTYQVVGEAVGIKVFYQIDGEWISDITPNLHSDELVQLSAFHVFTVDSEGQRLRSLDRQERQITMTMGEFQFQQLTVGGTANIPFNFSAFCDYPPTLRARPIMYTNGTTIETTARGHTSFDGVFFLRPPSGTYLFDFTDQTTGWTFRQPITIGVGRPFRLRICREPPLELNNLIPTLTRQPTLYIEDLSGNHIPGSGLSGIRVRAEYRTESTVTTAINQRDSVNRVRLGVPTRRVLDSKVESRVAQVSEHFLQFEGLEMRGLHGHVYYINFTAELTDAESNKSELSGIVSRGIRVAQCRNNAERAMNDSQVLMYFAMPGTSECFICPEGGLCDGTTQVRVRRNNLFRPDNESYKFYSCEIPDSGNSCVRPNGDCREGYKGPRCSVCAEGFGKDGFYCQKCPRREIVIAYMALVLVITLSFVTVLVYTSFTASLSETLPVLIKIGINHLQISSRINEIILMPQALQELFNAQLQISELVRFDLVSTECEPLELTIYGRFYLVVCIPAFMMVFYAFVFAGLAIYRKARGIGPKYTPVIATDKTQEVRRDRVMLTVAKFMVRIRAAAFAHHGDVGRDDLRPQFYTPTQYFTATSVIILFLVYPSVLQWAVSMWQCDEIVYGHGDGETYGNLRSMFYLVRDRSIDCTKQSHRVVQAWALTAAFVYGIGVPLLAIAAVRRHWFRHGRVHTCRLYAFVMLGFDISTWYWETVVMARKAAIVFVIIFIGEPILRTYLAMWTMAVALGAHGWFQPYDPQRPSLYYLEGLGITTITVTLNLSLLFQFDMFRVGTALHEALVIFLFTINVLVCVVFLLMIVAQTIQRIRAYFRGADSGDNGEELKDGAAFASTAAAMKARRRQRGPGAGTSAAAAAVEGAEDVDMDNLEVQESDFTEMLDRRVVQRDGILGALRKASKIKELQDADEAAAADGMPVINPATLPARAGETPFERVQRMEQERRRAYMRRDQAKAQLELEEELEELRDRLVRAQALAAAEEAVIAHNPDMAVRRQEHEEQLMRLMDEIRKERGEIVVKNDEHAAFSADILQSIQFENEEEELAFEDEDEDSDEDDYNNQDGEDDERGIFF